MRHRTLALTVACAGIVIAGILFTTGMKFAGARTSDVWFEVAKAGVGIFAVSIVGGGVAIGAKYWESLREERRRLNDFRVGLLRATVDAYHEIKSVRRRLRACGLFEPDQAAFSAFQCIEFHAQLHALNAAHLELERVRRELEAYPLAFSVEPRPHDSVKAVDKYVRSILRDWEKHGHHVAEGGSPSVLQHADNLRSFLVDSREAFAAGAARPMEQVEKSMHLHLLAPWRAAPPTRG